MEYLVTDDYYDFYGVEDKGIKVVSGGKLVPLHEVAKCECVHDIIDRNSASKIFVCDIEGIDVSDICYAIISKHGEGKARITYYDDGFEKHIDSIRSRLENLYKIKDVSFEKDKDGLTLVPEEEIEEEFEIKPS